MIPFNKPPIIGDEMTRVAESIDRGKTSGNGYFTSYCQSKMTSIFGGGKVLLTNSGTAALDMAALLCDIHPGDEVILPSFTFTSTANAFEMRGAKLVFADSLDEHPNLDTSKLDLLVTPKTKCIVVVHYAGMSCNMDEVMQIANANNIFVVEDCALAFGATYNDKHLGRSGHLSAFSFHETKTIACGEGGCLLINDSSMFERAEIIWEKGTNRAAFSRGEVSKYEWVDIGSSYVMSEIQAAWLSTQIDHYQMILNDRKKSYDYYFQHLTVPESKGKFKLPLNDKNGNHNASIFYLKCATKTYRDSLMHHLQDNGVLAVFHYLPLHQSPFFVKKYKGPQLINAETWSDSILRIPLFYRMEDNELEIVIQRITEYLS